MDLTITETLLNYQVTTNFQYSDFNGESEVVLGFLHWNHLSFFFEGRVNPVFNVVTVSIFTWNVKHAEDFRKGRRAGSWNADGCYSRHGKSGGRLGCHAEDTRLLLQLLADIRVVQQSILETAATSGKFVLHFPGEERRIRTSIFCYIAFRHCDVKFFRITF